MQTHNQKTPDNARIQVSIAVTVIISILLVLVGIWNSNRVALLIEENSQTSLQFQQLSEGLKIHQEILSTAVEAAVTYNEANWLEIYRQSYIMLEDTLLTSAQVLQENMVEKILNDQQKAFALELEMFRLVETGEVDLAFIEFASSEYQDLKISLEQDSLTLRAMLEAKSKEKIAELKQNVENSTIALIIQVIIICTLWGWVSHIIRQWQSEQTKHADQLSKLAHYDSLTGIANRTLFHLRLDAAFAHANRQKNAVALLLMDLDHFKDINDTLGHDAGDELLKYAATEIQKVLRETDTLARLGGDEFAVIATDIHEKRDITMLVTKILAIFDNKIRIKNKEVITGTSIGVAFYPDDTTNADELLRKADMALYDAKRNGRSKGKWFDPSIENAAKHKQEMQAEIITALQENQFEVYYQPLIDLKTDRIIAVESLVRWNHPSKGFISPDDFISIAEESRQIVEIGRWVLEEACRQQVEWCRDGIADIGVAVNLSGVQFNEANLTRTVQDIIEHSGISPQKLCLEITESTLMETQDDVIRKLYSLKALGLKLAIDDFGTGYSSLAYLKRFPIHHLKIDREFVNDLPDDLHDVAIARSIIKMAHELGIEVVAEGIENTAQLRFLADAKCNIGQGYHYGKPMPNHEFVAWIEHNYGSKQLFEQVV